MARVQTFPIGYESIATTIIAGLAAARSASPVKHVRPAAAPKPNCHDAVDSWTAANAGTHPVRGWLAIEQEGGPLRLIAHSVVRKNDDTLIDPTFAVGEPAYPFLSHPCCVDGFFHCSAGRTPPTSYSSS